MTIEQVIEQEMMSYTKVFWGQTYENFHPEKLDHVYGDGKRLIYLMPMNTRPYYYIARVDSQYPTGDDEETD